MTKYVIIPIDVSDDGITDDIPDDYKIVQIHSTRDYVKVVCLKPIE